MACCIVPWLFGLVQKQLVNFVPRLCSVQYYDFANFLAPTQIDKLKGCLGNRRQTGLIRRREEEFPNYKRSQPKATTAIVSG